MPSPRAAEELIVAGSEALMKNPQVAAAVEAGAKLGAEVLTSMGGKNVLKIGTESAAGFGDLSLVGSDSALKPGAVSQAFRGIFDRSTDILPKGQVGFVEMAKNGDALVARFVDGPHLGAKAIWKPGDPVMQVELPNGFKAGIDRFPVARQIHVDHNLGVHVDRSQALHPTEH